ncbi:MULTISPECIES: SVM family protein [Candidatus Phytoplasma]|uniref:SVM family protein n=3 Tax=Candidatus Phytoplasma TaxID=33926 RepID=A0AAP4X8L0_9MOLU|nr:MULTISPECIES: SVM family protein [Phytoplasma]QLL36890.1 putative secreted protein, AYWB SAP68-like ['Echinacea purpurea' witches'-broom phytoplasma]WEX20455.1 MAG: putative secreted protein, SAP68-like [Candidatus Phytoplasma aurantifolia]EMR14769.1 putative effector, AYWB SAP68-like protein [Peanut witches'-broom phytoplasma NTU2011]MDO8052917.1 SVM family protein ['Vigna radiata' phytoplasma]MDO8054664.1 SVM family protein [Candidatus Phytoplasma australasiaticum]
MMQVKKKLHLLPLFLMSFLGMFLIINNNPIMASSNGHANNNGHNINNNQSDLEIQANILLDLNLQQAQLVQQIFQARENNASEEFINNLMTRNMELSQRIATQQRILHNTIPQHSNRSNNSSRN